MGGPPKEFVRVAHASFEGEHSMRIAASFVLGLFVALCISSLVGTPPDAGIDSWSEPRSGRFVESAPPIDFECRYFAGRAFDVFSTRTVIDVQEIGSRSYPKQRRLTWKVDSPGNCQESARRPRLSPVLVQSRSRLSRLLTL
jgi:hypothetical protein